MKIIRKNKGTSDCSVVGTFNALSWCGQYRPYSEVEKMAKSVGYNPRKGIYDFQLVNLFNKLNVPYKRTRNPRLRQIESNLYLGKCYVFLYRRKGHNNGHIITVFMNKNGRIQIVNPLDDLLTWPDLAANAYAEDMSEFISYELPIRNAV